MNREEMLGPAVSPETGQVYERGTGYKGISIGAALFVAIGLKVFFTVSDAADIEDDIAASVRQAQASLPIQVDEATTITAIASNGNRVIYSLRIALDLPTAEVPLARREQQEFTRRNICGNPEGRRMVEAGAVLVYNFVDQSGDRFSTEVGSCAR